MSTVPLGHRPKMDGPASCKGSEVVAEVLVVEEEEVVVPIRLTDFVALAWQNPHVFGHCRCISDLYFVCSQYCFALAQSDAPVFGCTTSAQDVTEWMSDSTVSSSMSSECIAER